MATMSTVLRDDVSMVRAAVSMLLSVGTEVDVDSSACCGSCCSSVISTDDSFCIHITALTTT